VGKQNYNVTLFDHAEVAVARFRRVYKHSGRTGAGKGCGKFRADVSAFAYAEKHHFAAALEKRVDYFVVLLSRLSYKFVYGVFLRRHKFRK
jgi:hypothetical protein